MAEIALDYPFQEAQQEESSDSSFFNPEVTSRAFNVTKSLMEAVKVVADARKKHGDAVRVEIPGASKGFFDLVIVSYPEPGSLDLE